MALKTIAFSVLASIALYQLVFYEYQVMQVHETPPALQEALLGLNQACEEELQWFNSFYRKYLTPGFERYACVLRDNETKGVHPRVEEFFSVASHWLGFTPEVCFYVISKNFHWEAYGSHADTAVILNIKGNYSFCHYNFYAVMTNHRDSLELISEDPRGSKYFFAQEQLYNESSQNWQSSIHLSDTRTCASVVEGAYIRHNARHFHHVASSSDDYNHRIFCEASNTLTLRLQQAWHHFRHVIGSYFSHVFSSQDFGDIETLDLKFVPQAPPN